MIREPGHTISYKYAPREYSDLSAHPRNVISLHRTLLVGKDPKRLSVDGEDTDQPVWMSRLIGLFTGRPCYLMGMLYPGSNYSRTSMARTPLGP